MWYRISGRKPVKYWYQHDGEYMAEEGTLMEHLQKLLPQLDSVKLFYMKCKVQELLNNSNMSLEEIFEDIKSGKLFPSYRQGR